jgi:hypothetical protein
MAAMRNGSSSACRRDCGMSRSGSSLMAYVATASHDALLPNVKHRTSRYPNNRAENSHRPTRRREPQMQRFKSPSQTQDFHSAHGIIYGHFQSRRHRMTAAICRRHGPMRSGSGDRRPASTTHDEYDHPAVSDTNSFRFRLGWRCPLAAPAITRSGISRILPSSAQQLHQPPGRRSCSSG